MGFNLITLSGLGFSGWSILILSVAILTMLGSMIFNQGRSYSVESPTGAVTVQVLNGCGVRGAAESLAGALLPGDGSVMYDIIEKADAKTGAFARTVIVDRIGSSSSPGGLSNEALMMADRLGIDREDVILLRLEDNILDIDVTVIAGADYSGYVEKLNETRGEPL